jgi:hypothetical protein
MQAMNRAQIVNAQGVNVINQANQPNLIQQQPAQVQQQQPQQYVSNVMVQQPAPSQQPQQNMQQQGATDENDEMYKRKIDELRLHLPRLEKMYASANG